MYVEIEAYFKQGDENKGKLYTALDGYFFFVFFYQGYSERQLNR